MKTTTRLFMLLAMMLFGLFIMVFVMQLSLSVEQAGDTNYLKLYQLLQGVLVFAVPAFVGAYLWKQESVFQFLSLHRANKGWDYLFVLFLILGGFPVVNFLVSINEGMRLPEFLHGVEQWMRSTEMQNQQLIEQFLSVNSVGALFFNLLVMAVTPAVCEELLFRGTLQRLISDRLGVHWGIWIAAFLFSAIHLQFYGFIPRFLLGAVFGYLLLYSGSLYVPILAHFIHNAISVIFFYLSYNKISSVEFDAIGTGTTAWFSFVGLIVVLGWLYAIKRGGVIKG